ncbi:YbaN family protein [Thalassotalea euphylliae]|uniref:YbaN family protein n=1 Tax=Thalassotalea euphylliae TaxID=1655234 RepID=UPI003630541C
MFLYKLAGLFFVGLAALGAVLPVLPTTPFLLVAAACFAKSSPYLYQKLLDNRVFGPLIRDWQEYKAIPKRGKVIALMSIVLAVSWSCYVLNSWYWQLLVVALVTPSAIFIYRLPLSEDKIKEHKKSES